MWQSHVREQARLRGPRQAAGAHPLQERRVRQSACTALETIRPVSRAIATSMTQVLVDRFQTFDVFSSPRNSGNSGCIKNSNHSARCLWNLRDAAMSDLEFQRELNPEQMREALSLLDGIAGAQNQNLRIEDLPPAKDLNPEPDCSTAIMATQDRPPAAEGPLRRKKHLNLVVACLGVAIAAAGALALSSWSESVLSPPMPGIAQEQPPEESAPLPAKRASSALPVAKPPFDLSRGGSEPRPSTPELAGLSSAVSAAANSDNAISHVASSASDQATGTSQALWNGRVSRQSEHTWWRVRAVRVAAGKKRFWRRRWQARSDPEWCFLACRRADGEWCFFACRTRQAQRVLYEPPRSVTQ
jgi:hypothetical protein